MPYKLAWEPQGVLLCFSGQISIADIGSATVEYQGDSRFDFIRYVVADYSQITECNACPADIDEVWAVDLAAKLSNPAIMTVIVTTSPVIIRLANRYLAQDTPAFPVEIFASLGDARHWLGCRNPGGGSTGP